MQIVNHIGDGVLKKKVVTEISNADYEQMLASIAANLKAQILQQYQSELTSALDSFASESERATWSQQLLEAYNYINAAASTRESLVTPMLNGLIINRGLGETKEELANKIIAKATDYAARVSQILGNQKRELAQISEQNQSTSIELELN